MRPVLVLTATAACILAGAASAQAPAQRYLTWPGKEAPATQAAPAERLAPITNVGPRPAPAPPPAYVADRYGPRTRPDSGLSRPFLSTRGGEGDHEVVVGPLAQRAVAGGDSQARAASAPDRGGRVEAPTPDYASAPRAPAIYDEAPAPATQRLADTRPPLVGSADLSPPASGRESPEAAAASSLPPLHGEGQTREAGQGGEPPRQAPAPVAQAARPAAAAQPWSAGRGEGQGVPSRRYSVQREVGTPALDPAFFAAGQAADLAEPPPVVDPWYGQGRQPDPVAAPTGARTR